MATAIAHIQSSTLQAELTWITEHDETAGHLADFITASRYHAVYGEWPDGTPPELPDVSGLTPDRVQWLLAQSNPATWQLAKRNPRMIRQPENHVLATEIHSRLSERFSSLKPLPLSATAPLASMLAMRDYRLERRSFRRDIAAQQLAEERAEAFATLDRISALPSTWAPRTSNQGDEAEWLEWYLRDVPAASKENTDADLRVLAQAKGLMIAPGTLEQHITYIHEWDNSKKKHAELIRAHRRKAVFGMWPDGSKYGPAIPPMSQADLKWIAGQSQITKYLKWFRGVDVAAFLEWLNDHPSFRVQAGL